MTFAFSRSMPVALAVLALGGTIDAAHDALAPCDPPRITVQPAPANLTVGGGASVTYSVTASGVGLAYQWRHRSSAPLASFEPIPGANGPVLSLVDLSLGDSGSYACAVSNTCGTVRTRQVRLSVVPAGTEPFLVVVPVNTPVDLTPDGSVALLTDLASANGDVYLYRVATGTLDLVTQAGSPLRDFVTGISATERVSALHDDPVQAGLWTAAGGWLDLGSTFPMGCGMDISGAWDVSADGSVTVGVLWNGCAVEALRWSDASGTGVFTPMQVLGMPNIGTTLPPDNRATVVSDDGAIAAGFAETELVDRWPALWDASGRGFLLDSGGLFPDDAPGEVLSISADGSFAAGIWNLDGFVWSAATGVIDIGRLPAFLPFEPTFPNAVAADGALVFGGCGNGFFSIPAAFVWTAGGGMRSLEELAAANGVQIPSGLVLTNVLAASNDGEIVLGQGFDASFNTVSFVLRLPVSAYGL